MPRLIRSPIESCKIKLIRYPLPPLDLLLHHLAQPHVEKHGKDQVEARHQKPSNQTGEVLEEGNGVGDHVAQNHDLKDRKAKREREREGAESATAEIHISGAEVRE